jgi:hypothetical protein
LSCQLILNTTDVNGVHKVFNKFARNVIRRVDKNDPSAKRTIKACKNILELTAKPNSQTNMIRVLNVLVPVVLGVSGYYLMHWHETYNVVVGWVSISVTLLGSITHFITQTKQRGSKKMQELISCESLRYNTQNK